MKAPKEMLYELFLLGVTILMIGIMLLPTQAAAESGIEVGKPNYVIKEHQVIDTTTEIYIEENSNNCTNTEAKHHILFIATGTNNGETLQPSFEQGCITDKQLKMMKAHITENYNNV